MKVLVKNLKILETGMRREWRRHSLDLCNSRNKWPLYHPFNQIPRVNSAVEAPQRWEAAREGSVSISTPRMAPLPRRFSTPLFMNSAATQFIQNRKLLGGRGSMVIAWKPSPLMKSGLCQTEMRGSACPTLFSIRKCHNVAIGPTSSLLVFAQAGNAPLNLHRRRRAP